MLLWALEPLMILFLAALFLHERIERGMSMADTIAEIQQQGGLGGVLRLQLQRIEPGKRAGRGVAVRRLRDQRGRRKGHAGAADSLPGVGDVLVADLVRGERLLHEARDEVLPVVEDAPAEDTPLGGSVAATRSP